MNLRFKEGDRVVGKEGVPLIGGKVGTVVYLVTEHHDYGIQFDELVYGGHDLGDATNKYGYCRWVKDEELNPYNEAAYFAEGRVGDGVYDWVKGDGLILCFDTEAEYPIHVKFEGLPVETFTFGGASTEGGNQTLFYSRPIFDLPPPPKRKVKKVIEGWENRYADDLIYPTKDIADRVATTIKGRLGEAVFIRHEYEELI